MSDAHEHYQASAWRGARTLGFMRPRAVVVSP